MSPAIHAKCVGETVVDYFTEDWIYLGEAHVRFTIRFGCECRLEFH
jgi:hypothetical protein